MSTAITSLRLRELFPIGSGGMGTTYLACSTAGQFERLVVVKRLHEHLVDDEQARQRFLEEAELAGYVHHANVVSVHHVGSDERGVFLVLDYVDGTSLRRLIQASKPNRIPEPIVLRIILDCLAGLSAIHTTTDHRKRPLRILHRDVTPENILLGLDGVARLTDFGIAKSTRSVVQTAPLQLIGKLPFMAPEYIDRAEVGPPLDIYAVGVSLWRLLAGRPPWSQLEEAQLLVRILTEGVPPLPRELEIGERLRAVVARACALDPAERFQTARAMAAAIEDLEPEHSIAEHAQVAEFLAEIVGAETASVRERASERLDDPSLPPPGPVPPDFEAREPSVLVEPNPPTFRSPELPTPAPDTSSNWTTSTHTSLYRKGQRLRFLTLGGIVLALGASSTLSLRLLRDLPPSTISTVALSDELEARDLAQPHEHVGAPLPASDDPPSRPEIPMETKVVEPHPESPSKETVPPLLPKRPVPVSSSRPTQELPPSSASGPTPPVEATPRVPPPTTVDDRERPAERPLDIVTRNPYRKAAASSDPAR